MSVILSYLAVITLTLIFAVSAKGIRPEKGISVINYTQFLEKEHIEKLLSSIKRVNANSSIQVVVGKDFSMKDLLNLNKICSKFGIKKVYVIDDLGEHLFILNCEEATEPHEKEDK